ncbi:MAG: T9SS type A sorting domain-containing protein [Bacteroidota bacterium]
MKHVLTFLCLSLLGLSLFAQPISTFPYVENFDSFPVSTPASDEPNPDTFMGGWENELAGDGTQDWYGWTGTTPSTNTGPNGDHTSGSGVYLYMEDSGGNANQDTVILNTPIFDISSLASPHMIVWVHSNEANGGVGAGGGVDDLNDLKIEILFSGNWIELDSIGHIGPNWTQFAYDLTPFSGIVQLRFRGNTNNFGQFVHDIAIDDFSIVDLPSVDAVAISSSLQLNTPATYTQAPVSQAPAYTINATFQNFSQSTLFDVDVVANFGAYTDTFTIDTAESLAFASGSFSMPYSPTMAETGTITVVATGDTISTNNSVSLAVPDSIFARDDSVSSGGLGFTGGTGVFGNMFELTSPDVLTSVSILLRPTTTEGDSVRFWLYEFGNDIANSPDSTAIDSTDIWVIPDDGWFTLPWSCQTSLDAGQYFIAIQQINLNNLGFGYDSETYIVNTTFFGSGTSTWTEIGTIANGDLASSMMLRMNFGPTTAFTQLSTSDDLVCEGDSITLSATGTGTYAWFGVGVPADSSSSISFPLATSGTYLVTLTDNNGCVSTDSIAVTAAMPPSTDVDSTLAFGGLDNGSAIVVVSGGTPPYTYAWDDSTAQTTAEALNLGAGTYTVTVTDSAGCVVMASVDVTSAPVSIDPAQEAQVRLYPNPSSGSFTIEGLHAFDQSEVISLRIFDPQGKLIHQDQLEGINEVQLNLDQGLSNGLYLIELRSGTEKVSRRITLMR